MLTLIQAQERYIAWVNSSSTQHRVGRVRRAAGKQLRRYLVLNGATNRRLIDDIVRDAWDMAELERNAD